MGCIQSKAEVDAEQTGVAGVSDRSILSVPGVSGAQVGITLTTCTPRKRNEERDTHPSSAQMTISTAKWQVSPDNRTYLFARSGPTHVMMGVFAGVSGASAALFCHRHVHSTLMACLATTPDVSAALRATLQQLDEDYLASSSVTAADKEAHGASALLAYIDLDARRMYMATCGAVLGVLCSVRGAFNAQEAVGQVITENVHTTR